MNPVLKKLNYKQHSEIVVLNAPLSFQAILLDMPDVANIHTTIPEGKELEFILVFATTQSQVNEAVNNLIPLLKADGVVWFAYPKGTSKKYTCEFNRDTGWHILGSAGFEAVRQIAIDEDWTALRFRQTQFIKSLKRQPGMAMSHDGKARTTYSSKK
jgi:hypothetical protein